MISIGAQLSLPCIGLHQQTSFRLFFDMSHIDNALSFLPDTLCIDEIHLSLVDALLMDKFPSFVVDTPTE